MKRALKIPRLLLNGKSVVSALRQQMAGKGSIKDNRLHIKAGCGWLTLAQQKGGGGFSRKYCLYGGWDEPYIETTGYIIPTMLAAGRVLEDARLIEGAKSAAHWLLGMQMKNGAFSDADTGLEQAFDTGQVLTGLVAAFREWGDVRFLAAATRAGAWLVEVQEQDGSWERYAYNAIKHAYYVKVAAALLQLASITGEALYHEAALKNIRWTLACQTQDGYFRHAQFRAGDQPFLHTIIYVLEGLMDSYDILKDENILDAAMRSVTALKEINQKRDLLLCSQYAENWLPANRERCITGLAQWACIAIRAYELTGDETLLAQAIKTIYYLKSKQYLQSAEDLYGGLPGSVPLWGKYIGFCYPNWGVKFFIDALIAYEKYSIPAWREQETWVSESFRFSDAVVAEGMAANDRRYVALMEKELDTSSALTILDAGCGKGKFIDYFRAKYPHWTVTGVDPSFSDRDRIRAGSVYSLPVPDGYADVVLLIEVMQHIDELDKALTELSRVTKAGGHLIIGDRTSVSLIGILKPFMEMAGLWMYPWDSPFQEQWRSIREWRKFFGENWQVTSAHSFDNPDNRIPLSNRFYLLMARKKGS
jgi:SAM-dependent methyltransferase